eukprot:1156586-Pelagomonas_calceolata.AAC.2
MHPLAGLLAGAQGPSALGKLPSAASFPLGPKFNDLIAVAYRTQNKKVGIMPNLLLLVCSSAAGGRLPPQEVRTQAPIAWNLS